MNGINFLFSKAECIKSQKNLSNQFGVLLPQEINDIIVYEFLGLYCHSCKKKYEINDFLCNKTKPLEISSISCCSWDCFYSHEPFKGMSVWGNQYK